MGSTPMTEDFEFGQYVHALTTSSNRVRYLIFGIVVTTVVVLAGYRHAQEQGWTMSRVDLMRQALHFEVWRPDVQKELASCALEVEGQSSAYPIGSRSGRIKEISKAHGFDGGNCWKLNYVVSTLGLGSKEDIRNWLDKIEQAQIDDIIVMRMPFLETPFDVNDLGVFSGLTYMVLMLTLWFALVRQQENLYLSMWKVRTLAKEEGGDPEGRANLLYHALSMTQLFTTPPTLARWKTGLTDWLPRLFFVVPPLMQWFVIRNDLKTYNRGSMVNEEAAFWGWWFELITFLVIVTAAVICFLHARASDCIWIKTFKSLNPGVELRIQPSWLEWVRLKKKAQAPGWGIAVHAFSETASHVFVADFRDGKVWSFADPGPGLPELVVKKRCRELGVSPEGHPYGEHIPYDPPSKKWTYSRWSSVGGTCMDDLSPTSRPALGQGVLRDKKSNRYSIDGRGPGGVQILYKTYVDKAQKKDGPTVCLAGGRRGVSDGEGRDAGFEWVQDMAVASDGTLYLTDGGCVRRITETGVVSTLGGNPIGGKRRYRRSRLLGVAETDQAIYAADYDFHHVWKVPKNGDMPQEIWHAGPWWSPAGLAKVEKSNHLYILEHRPDSLAGRILARVRPWSRVRKIDLAAPDAEPDVVVTFGRRRRMYRKPTAASPSEITSVSA